MASATMSASRCSCEAYMGTGRPSCTPSSAAESASAFRVRWATTWARLQPGQQAGLGPLVVAESVDGADQSSGTGLEQRQELGIGHGSTVTRC